MCFGEWDIKLFIRTYGASYECQIEEFWSSHISIKEVMQVESGNLQSKLTIPALP